MKKDRSSGSAMVVIGIACLIKVIFFNSEKDYKLHKIETDMLLFGDNQKYVIVFLLLLLIVVFQLKSRFEIKNEKIISYMLLLGIITIISTYILCMPYLRIIGETLFAFVGLVFVIAMYDDFRKNK